MERPGLERVTFQLLKNYCQLVRSFMLIMNSRSRAELKTWLEHLQTDSFDVAFEVEMEIEVVHEAMESKRRSCLTHQ